jgi:DNA (cytosine-5)-methyltransferase 1
MSATEGPRVDNKRPIGIDLFCGAGGLSLGFEQAGFDVVAGVEIDPIHAATHEFNFPHSKSICRSVTNLNAADIRRMAGLGDREIDVVFGGAPCQGFSMIGYRALDDPRNELVYHFIRLVKELKAKYFVFENVRGLTIGRHRRFLDEVIAECRSRGEYDVVEPYQVLNAASFGVPQNRERLFLLGARKGRALPSYPSGGVGVCVRDALLDLPNADDIDELVEGDCAVVKFGAASDYAKKLRGISRDRTDYSYPRAFDARLLTSSNRTTHTPLSRKRFRATKQGSVEPVSRFLKLKFDGLCNTLRAGTASDRGAHTSPRPIHPTWPRVITVREAARLHSYPDWFRFHVTKWHGFRQVGNSVPPLLARAVAAEVIRALGTKPRRPAKKIHLEHEALLRFGMVEACKYYGVPFGVIPQRKRLPAEGKVEKERSPQLSLVPA